ncbi:sensor histidine kinase [Marinobacterium sp. LSUCC0821]|uniref:sensor histidine kinase n=1 Tax=Marinobacterium sp. LSUCC0821 TaxID=2668067 RepID=UPI0014513FFC|nr:sensor histidine kinase [Marinobacterium sp. LSUCC0821]QJD72068.1 sensor histidine kinase [Marinobacterium sp. LSUCC0821]
MITIPLTILSVGLGIWRYEYDSGVAEKLSDRTLFSTAIAISRDTATLSGDLISVATRDIITNATGGEIFYHVAETGGFHLTGYAYPPADFDYASLKVGEPVFATATYRGEPVRVVALKSIGTISGFERSYIVTVWQSVASRTNLQFELALRTLALFFVLILVLGVVVWIAVKRGLRPLQKIEKELSERSVRDLKPIAAPVPAELDETMRLLNGLLSQLKLSLDQQHDFVSDAAHQLRNPAAAVSALVSTFADAKSEEDRKEQLNQLKKAARQGLRVSQQLLSLERIDSLGDLERAEHVNLNEIAFNVCKDMAPEIIRAGIEFEYIEAGEPLVTLADKVAIEEALRNLIDNAEKHGGESLNSVTVETFKRDQVVCIRVTDDGADLKPEDSDKVFSRFRQLQPSEGSGLGLSIASTAALKNGGKLVIESVNSGASLTLSLPCAN